MAAPEKNTPAKGKLCGRAEGRKALSSGEGRVQVGGQVVLATAAAFQTTSLGVGATLDAWWEGILRLRRS